MFSTVMAWPGQRATHLPQPMHLSPSSFGALDIAPPRLMAPVGQAISQGLQGMHWMHSMTATGPFAMRSRVGMPAQEPSSSALGMPV